MFMIPFAVQLLVLSIISGCRGASLDSPVEDDRPVWAAGSTESLDEFPARLQAGEKQGRVVPQSNNASEKVLGTIKVEEERPLIVGKFMLDFVNTPSMIYCLNYCTFPGTYPLAQGGTNALPHEFPHMVALGFRTSQTFPGQPPLTSWQSCGGSLISKNFVLTAAHCIDSERGPPAVVRLGEHDLSVLEGEVSPQDVPIKRIVVHPSYNASLGIYHDIALLEMTQSVNFTRVWNLGGNKDLLKVIWPACLHQGLNVKRYEEENKKVALPREAVGTGWGNTGFVDAAADILQKVALNIIDHATCSRLLGKDTLIPNGVDEKTQICAGVLVGGRDTCSGDSGGPLQINNTMFLWRRYCPNEIVGITSLGRFCGEANTPSVYTRVSYYVPWIESIVWPTVGKVYNVMG